MTLSSLTQTSMNYRTTLVSTCCICHKYSKSQNLSVQNLLKTIEKGMVVKMMDAFQFIHCLILIKLKKILSFPKYFIFPMSGSHYGLQRSCETSGTSMRRSTTV